VVAAAVALIALGVILGLFFPVMFVAAAVGVVLLVVFLVGAARRATTDETRSDEAAPDRAR
jgi:uncharacterized membrane protein